MSPQKELTERFQEMLEMRKEGRTVTEIAAHFGISTQRVSWLFKSHGHQLRFIVPDEEFIRIGNPQEVADRYGVTLPYVKKRMRNLGLKFPRKPGGPRSIWTKEKVAQLYQEYLDGANQTQIAAKYGIAQNTVSKIFRIHGFKARKAGWPLDKPRKYN